MDPSLSWSITAWFFTSLALVGNSILISVICCKRELHTTPNWFILSLAVADFGVGLSLMPVNTICMSLPCSQEFVAMSQWFFLYSSVGNLCTMTLDRYIAIVKPFLYVFFSQGKQTALLMSSGWLVPLVVSFLPATFIFTKEADRAIRIYSVIPPLLFEIFPCFFLSIAAGRILYIAKKQRTQTAIMLNQLRVAGGVDTRRPQRRNANGSVAAIATVVAIFLLCYSFALYSTLSNFLFGPSSQLAYQLQPVIMLLNSSANPLAYGFLKNDIKREFKNLLCCCHKY